jgi:hypothetical protein
MNAASYRGEIYGQPRQAKPGEEKTKEKGNQAVE